MPDRLIEIGWTLTRIITVPVVLALLVYCMVSVVRERRRELSFKADYKCLYCDHKFPGSQLKWDGRKCPRCNMPMVRVSNKPIKPGKWREPGTMPHRFVCRCGHSAQIWSIGEPGDTGCLKCGGKMELERG